MAVQLCSTKASNHEKHDGRYFKLKSSKLLFMIVLYIVFLLVGAGVFNFIEQKAEHQRCKTSRDTVRQAVDKMTDEYFYLLNVNLKICKGIKAVKEGDTSEFNAVLLSYIYDWEATNCSREGQRIFSEKSDLYNKQEDTANEFQQLWGTVMQKSHLKHFDDEVFTISGKVLNKIVKTSAEFSIKNYMEIRENCGQKWSFNNAFFFAGTLASTIGYGNLTPSTQFGKVFCLVFILFGIPYFGLLMREMSQFINDLLCELRNEIEDYFLKTLPYYTLPSTYIMIGVVFLILIPSWIFATMEDWSFGDSFYFGMISLSTIGFGDFVPNMNPPLKHAEKVYEPDDCLSAIIKPMPEDPNEIDDTCQKTKWPHSIEIIFSSYRLAVFFWILLGLVWLSGVVSLVVNGIGQSRELAKRLHSYGHSKITRSRRGSLKKSESIPESMSLPTITLSTDLSAMDRDSSATTTTTVAARKPLQLTVSNAL